MRMGFDCLKSDRTKLVESLRRSRVPQGPAIRLLGSRHDSTYRSNGVSGGPSV